MSNRQKEDSLIWFITTQSVAKLSYDKYYYRIVLRHKMVMNLSKALVNSLCHGSKKRIKEFIRGLPEVRKT